MINERNKFVMNQYEVGRDVANQLKRPNNGNYPTPSYCHTGGRRIITKYKKRANKKYKKTKKRKWSKKYKKSIDCNIPKGFSQRQYCLSKNKTSKRRK